MIIVNSEEISIIPLETIFTEADFNSFQEQEYEIEIEDDPDLNFDPPSWEESE